MKIKSKAVIKKEIDVIIDLFIDSGISESELERCLDFPRGSLKKNYSIEMLTIFKILKQYPWMLHVAEKNYNTDEAKRIMCHAAVDVIFDKLKKN